MKLIIFGSISHFTWKKLKCNNMSFFRENMSYDVNYTQTKCVYTNYTIYLDDRCDKEQKHRGRLDFVVLNMTNNSTNKTQTHNTCLNNKYWKSTECGQSNMSTDKLDVLSA